VVRTTIQGNYPKISSNRDDPNLRAARNRLDRGTATHAEVEGVVQDTIRRVVREQEDAGVDVVTDGQIRWDDLVTPLARKIESFEIGGLIRFFDNNTYYRRPIVKGPVRWTEPILIEEWKFASDIAAKPLKQVIPGPFTLASLSLDEHYGDIGILTRAVAEALAEEVRALQLAGCHEIQIDEPSACYAGEDIGTARKALDIVLGATTMKKTLWFYFGQVADPLRLYADAEVDQVGVDVVSWPQNWEAVRGAEFRGEVCLGCFDARNTRIEESDRICAMIDVVAKTTPPDRIWISPSAGLEFLPHDRARRKLRAIVDTARKYNSG
jgi:5-methyltetrahydropteroyltriglutamate--homocysteine methyltransferase